MKILNKLMTSVGLLLAPWLFLGARIFRSTALAEEVVRLDPKYLRALNLYNISGSQRKCLAQLQIASILCAEATPEAAIKVKELLSFSESQLLQDIFCAVALNLKTNGFFVEVGVGAGRAISNTYMLEKKFGWKGVLVEPNRSSHVSILACREAILERRAAASKTGKQLKFQEVVNAGEFSRIAGTADPQNSDEIVEEYNVETVTLTEVLDEIKAPFVIDFLSLDTEGSEIEILKGLDLSRYQFKVMALEHNYDQTVKAIYDSLLIPLGYRSVFKSFSGFDAWYVHESVSVSGFRRLQRLK